MRRSTVGDVCLVVVVGKWTVPAAFVLGVVVIHFLIFSTRPQTKQEWTTPRAF